MKACYKKIKTVVRPAALSGVSDSKSRKQKFQDTSRTTSSHLRHAKCLQPHDTLHPSALRRKRTLSLNEPITTVPHPGSFTLAQIRSVPLNVNVIRGQRESRSSYVVNAEQIRSRVPPLLKRSRSLSPQILRTTAMTELTSPTLVRSVSNCCPTTKSIPAASSTLRGTTLRRGRGWAGVSSPSPSLIGRTTARSLIPVRSPPSSRRSGFLSPKTTSLGGRKSRMSFFSTLLSLCVGGLLS